MNDTGTGARIRCVACAKKEEACTQGGAAHGAPPRTHGLWSELRAALCKPPLAAEGRRMSMRCLQQEEKRVQGLADHRVRFGCRPCTAREAHWSRAPAAHVPRWAFGQQALEEPAGRLFGPPPCQEGVGPCHAARPCLCIKDAGDAACVHVVGSTSAGQLQELPPGCGSTKNWHPWAVVGQLVLCRERDGRRMGLAPEPPGIRCWSSVHGCGS